MEKIQSKNNLSGDLYKVNLNKTSIYNIFTKAGKYRGGKIYSEDKYFVILSGKAEVTTLGLDNKDIKIIYQKQEIIKIPAGVANVFYFIENTEMLEWFPINVKTEKFERYYSMKQGNVRDDNNLTPKNLFNK